MIRRGVFEKMINLLLALLPYLIYNNRQNDWFSRILSSPYNWGSRNSVGPWCNCGMGYFHRQLNFFYGYFTSIFVGVKMAQMAKTPVLYTYIFQLGKNIFKNLLLRPLKVSIKLVYQQLYELKIKF